MLVGWTQSTFHKKYCSVQQEYEHLAELIYVYSVVKLFHLPATACVQYTFDTMVAHCVNQQCKYILTATDALLSSKLAAPSLPT